ncbi:LOW QUALITY PROTEIN: hypothetical protein MC885_010445 [Smutsia gigantea]|nr:LOW QUALITY PROTEIN: hypothetical protein MC885_010445 [Smutsia gigantea]
MVRGRPSVYKAPSAPSPHRSPQRAAVPRPPEIRSRSKVALVPGRCSFEMVISGVPGSLPRWAAARTLHTRIPERRSPLEGEKGPQ